MADELIDSFISEAGKRELKDAIADLSVMAESIVALNKQQIKLEVDTKGAGSMADLVSQTKKLDEAKKELSATQSKLNTSTAALEKQQRDLNKINADVINDYKQMSLAYNEAALRAKNYDIQLGKNHASTVQAVADANKLGAELKRLDASVGQHQRNVGNYASGFNALGNSIGQVARELPNFAINIQAGVSSLSNQYGQIMDAVKGINAQNKILLAEGKPVQSLWKQLGAAVFSLNTAIAVGVTLAVAYGDDIIKAFKGVSGATKDAEKAQKKYTETLNTAEEQERSTAQQQIARINVLTTLAADEAQSTRTRNRAIKELQETYPAYFGNLEKEILLQGQATDSINKATEALLNRAAAQAAEKKFAAASEKVYDLTLALRKANDELSGAQKRSGGGQDEEERGLNKFFNQAKVSEAKKNISDISSALVTAESEQKQFLKNAQDFSQLAGDAIFGKDAKPAREKKIKEMRDLMAEYRRAMAGDPGEFSPNDIIGSQDADIILKAEIRFNTEQTKEAVDKVTLEVNQQLVGIENSFAMGLYKNQKEYEDAKLQAQIDGAQKRYEAEKLGLEKQLMLLGYDADERTVILNKIAELEVRIVEDKNKRIIKSDADAAKERLETYKKIEQATKRFADELNELLVTLSNARAQKEIERLEKEGELIDENLKKSIAYINLTTVSEEEKQKRIAAAEKEAQKDREQIERKKIDAQRKAARFERAITIGQIVAQTAEAVIKAYNDLPFPGNIALAALYAATGAAQIATVVAQPLPAYAVGTDNAPEGFAVVGEKGTEMKIDPSGRISFTPDTATIDYLQAGTKIIPADKTQEIIRLAALHQLPLIRIGNEQGQDVVSALDKQTANIVKAINKNGYRQDKNGVAWGIYIAQKTRGIA